VTGPTAPRGATGRDGSGDRSDTGEPRRAGGPAGAALTASSGSLIRFRTTTFRRTSTGGGGGGAGSGSAFRRRMTALLTRVWVSPRSVPTGSPAGLVGRLEEVRERRSIRSLVDIRALRMPASTP
jgi:hypothetical protein